MTNRELAEILLQNPDQEVIMPVFNGEVGTYSSIRAVYNLSPCGVYNDMYNTLDGEIDMELFRRLEKLYDFPEAYVSILEPTLQENLDLPKVYSVLFGRARNYFLNTMKEGEVKYGDGFSITKQFSYETGPQLFINEEEVSEKDLPKLISLFKK